MFKHLSFICSFTKTIQVYLQRFFYLKSKLKILKIKFFGIMKNLRGYSILLKILWINTLCLTPKLNINFFAFYGSVRQRVLLYYFTRECKTEKYKYLI